MSTGIHQIMKQRRNKIPITVTYTGKINESNVLHEQYKSFDKISSVNGCGCNYLFVGDNKDAMLFLLNNGCKGKIRLIYIDPPFATLSDYISRDQELAYCDSLCGGEYVEFLRQRLIIMRELLASDGSIYLHLDGNMAFAMKLIMDEIFGEDNCRAFITRRKCSTKNYTKNTYGNISDYILFYSKSGKYIWNRPYFPWELDNMAEQYPCVDEKTGRRYKKVPLHAPGIRNGETGKEWRGRMPPKGKHWQYTPDTLDALDAAGEIYWSAAGNPRRKVFCDADKGVPVQDIWLNYRDSVNQSQMTTGYPTEKNYEMLKLIVKASSNPGDIVMDCFAGSGTALGAAFETDRQWIGIDCAAESLKAILKRFTVGLEAYGDYVSECSSFQSQLDVIHKCPFEIWGTDSNKDLIAEKVNEFCR